MAYRKIDIRHFRSAALLASTLVRNCRLAYVHLSAATRTVTAGTRDHVVNLRLAHKLIAEAEHERGSYVVRGREAAREVQFMAEAGLVKATESLDIDPPQAVITKITHAGHQFYHALNNVRSFANS